MYAYIGQKATKQGMLKLAITNSDPKMILLIMDWFKKIYAIDKKELIFRISINSVHQKREIDVKKFWTNTLKVSSDQFTKTSFIESVSKKVYSNSNNYFGVIRVKVRRGTNLRNRILGAIEFLSKK